MPTRSGRKVRAARAHDPALSDKTRVLIVDDHTLVRQGVRALLEAKPDLEIVGEAADGHEAIRLAADLRPDIVVLDLSMPVLGGVDTTTKLLRDAPGVKIIALTMHDEEEHVYSLLKAGAQGFVLKDSASSELLQAIRAVRDGGIYLNPRISTQVVNEYLKRPHPRFRKGSQDGLTPRETQVLRLISEAHTNKEIATVLAISVKTVEAHRARIMERLKIHNIAGLTRYAIRRGITGVEGPG